jgi:transaldolase
MTQVMTNSFLERKRVKIFADGADLEAIVALAARPEIAGVTTNPTLMRKAAVRDYRGFAAEVLARVRDKPVSFEVVTDELPEMVRQAREIASWGPNVNVKIPVTNARGQSALAAAAELSHGGVKVNVTGCLTLEQVTAASRAVAGGEPAIVSVFAGRIADTGRSPLPTMAAAAALCHAAGPHIELLWASPRELLNVVQADEVGCDIITVTPDILAKLPLLGRDLLELSLETVQMFHRDAAAAGYRL